MKNENEDVLVLQQKVKHYKELGVPIHLKYKKGFWKNGHILEISADFFMINEFLEGEFPVFFLELEYIEEYKKEIETITKKKEGKE